MYIKYCCTSNVCVLTSWICMLLIAGTLSINPYADEWGVTQVNVKKFSYLWTISNYSLNDLKTGENFYSPIFPRHNSDKYQWQVQWGPKGSKDKPNSALLNFQSKSDFNVTAYCEFCIIDGNAEKTNLHSYKYSFSKDHSSYFWDNFISQSDLQNKTKNLLPNDKLTILVEMVVTEGIANFSGNCRFTKNVSNHEYMAQLLENSFLSDVKLRVEDQVIQAHRAILATQSSAFFQEFIENPNLDVIHVQNATIAAAKQALRFMYTGKVEIDEENSEELLSLSNQLGISQLKLMCEEVLCKSMRPSNATDILMLADLHDAKNLAREASNYIAAHAATVVDSPDFKELEKSYPNPFYNILRKIVNKKEN